MNRSFRRINHPPPVSSWNPSWESGLRAWWRSYTIVGLVNNDLVATWNDESGNDFHLSQVLAANKPTYKTNIQNGLPVVRFDGVDNFMYNTTFTATAAMDIYFVASNNGWQTPQDTSMIGWGMGTAPPYVGFVGLLTAASGAPQDLSLVGLGNNGAPPLISYTNTITDGTMVAGRILLATGGNAMSINGSAVATTLDIAGADCDAVNTGLEVGCYNAPADSFWPGDIGEIVIFNSALADPTLCINYLMRKWKIT